MKQTKKSWVKEFDEKFVKFDPEMGEFSIRDAKGNYHSHGLVSIKQFISQLLAKEREEILDEAGKMLDEHCIDIRWKVFWDWDKIKAKLKTHTTKEEEK